MKSQEFEQCKQRMADYKRLPHIKLTLADGIPSKELCKALDEISSHFVRGRYLNELVFEGMKPGRGKTGFETSDYVGMNCLIGSTRHFSIRNCKVVHHLYISCLVKALNSLTVENSPVRLITSEPSNKGFAEYFMDRSIENT